MVTLYCRFLVLAHMVPTAMQAAPMCLWYPISWFLGTTGTYSTCSYTNLQYHCRCYHLCTLQVKLLPAALCRLTCQVPHTSLWYLAWLCFSMAIQNLDLLYQGMTDRPHQSSSQFWSLHPWNHNKHLSNWQQTDCTSCTSLFTILSTQP